MFSLKRNSILLLAAVFVCGCGSSDSTQEFPSRDARDAIAVELPAFAELSNLEFVAVQNTGDEITPSFRARFEGELTMRVDTYAVDGRENNATFLRVVLKEGDKRKIFGIISVNYEAGGWVGRPKFDRLPMEGAGLPRDLVASGSRTVVRGTSEVDDYAEELAAKARAEAQAREEQSRAEARAREERASAEARAREEQARAEAQAREEQAKAAAERERLAAQAREQQAAKIRGCSLDSIAGAYRSEYGTLVCSESDETLVCCYGGGSCTKRIELSKSSDRLSLTGKWIEPRSSGVAMFPISEECALASGLWGKGSTPGSTWKISGRM